MRDLTASGRYPPQPRFTPFQFYSSVRLGDPDQLKLIMITDPYFVTQDNGAGAPLHFAATYKQLDMMHHLLNMGAEVNQRDERGFTPLHRAAHLAHYAGYLEIYEYLLSRGADPSIRTENYDPYLDPGLKTPLEVACEDEEIRDRLVALDELYAGTTKMREPHPDVGCWWTLYDYGIDTVKTWSKDYKHPYPEEILRAKEKAERKAAKAERRRKKAEAAAAAEKGSVGTEPGADGSDTKAAVPQKPAATVTATAPPAATRPPVPQTPIAFLFPGQGSQAVGMLKASKDLPAVAEMLRKAQAILGYDLLALCLEGPKEKLDQTEYAQPALFVAGLAAAEALRAADPKAAAGCSAAAGLSLGEYTALVWAGALSFEDGLKVVKTRGESMAAAAQLGEPHGMLSVIGLSDADLEAVIAAEFASGVIKAGSICQLANYLFPQGRVVSGHTAALDAVSAAAIKKGALKAARLPVSGAFHTPLMQPARDALVKVLADVKFSEPRVPVYSNVTGAPIAAAADIPALLARQLVEPVQWEGTLKALVGAGKQELFELGPGAQIKAMVKRIDTGVWKAFKNTAA